MNALKHYELYGWHQGLDPSAAYSMTKCLPANPDVKAAGIDPLLHHVKHGKAEGRAIYPGLPYTSQQLKPSGKGGLGRKRTENLCKPGSTSGCGAVASS